MNCNNKFCYWQAFDCCCNVDDDLEKANPNEIECKISLRRDFEEQFKLLHSECIELLSKLNFEEMIKIRKILIINNKK